MKKKKVEKVSVRRNGEKSGGQIQKENKWGKKGGGGVGKRRWIGCKVPGGPNF